MSFLQREVDDTNPWMSYLEEEETQELRHRLHLGVKNNLHIILLINNPQVMLGREGCVTL